MDQKNLFTEIKDKITQFEELTDIDAIYLDEVKSISAELPEIIKASEELIEQNNTLRIGIIGQVKAGKSSFLNALLFEGKDLLPKASTPMTAGLTVIAYGEQPKFKVEYYSKEDWKTIEDRAKEYDQIYKEIKDSDEFDFEDEKEKNIAIDEATKERAGDLVCSSKELVEQCGPVAKSKIGAEPLEQTLTSIDELQGKLNQYVGANGEFTSITKTLYLYLPEEGLKGIEIVDTPGINDPIVSREERTNAFLRSCHGVFLLSYSGQFCSNTDMTFLKERVYDQGISSVVVLGSKFDSGLIDIARTTDGDLEYALENLTKSLTDGLKEAFIKKDFKKDLPQVDCTSGLCYSLYSKEESEWDENEAHVAKLLATNYPVFNNNKELFKLLGNIEGIKSKYVDLEFKENKERIIADKISSFNENNKTNIKKTVVALKDGLEKYSKKLESINSNDLGEQKLQKGNVEKLGNKANGIISGIKVKVNYLPGNILNTINFEDIPQSAYVKEKSFEVVQKSKYLIGLNSKKSVLVELVDSEVLRSLLRKYCSEKTREIINKWSELLSLEGGILKDVEDKILNELKGEFSNIDPDFFVEALQQTLDEISGSAAAFPTEEIELFYNGRIEERIAVADRSNWSKIYEYDSRPKEILDSATAAEKKKYSVQVVQITTDYKIEVKNKMSKNKEKVVEFLNKLENSFAANISKEFDRVTQKYQQALEGKEIKLQAIKKGIAILKDIETIMDK